MGKIEGEGNRTAARAYNKATTRFARSGRVAPAAKRAVAAFDGAEGKSLRAAERIGRAKARGSAARKSSPA